MNATRDRYFIHAVAHAVDVLRAFGTPKEVLRLRDIVARAGHSKNITFRLLYTLERTGLIEKVGANEYRSTLHHHKLRKFKIGYAAQGSDYLFSHQVTSGLKREADRLENVELLTLDNRYSAKVALKNADLFVKERCDLVIEFQTDENVAPIISAKYREAKIPMIAVEIPHPGAVYFGANNYEAGLLGGRALGRWARQNWEGRVDSIVLMELPRAGAVPRARLTGILVGIREVLPHLETCPVVHLDGDGCFEPSWKAMRTHLKKTMAERCLVSGINDASALGALRAFEECGRVDGCVVAGQNAAPEGRDELRRPSRFIASVAYFPEKYGPGLLKLAQDILTFKSTPPAVFVAHQLLTPKNVDQFYPNEVIS
ncbi:MAG: substrate-binding domain-containing protein [Acidobacteria bacterium]|nr:substrate-binding domain-containing protein [Acidobacteriota bacterium]